MKTIMVLLVLLFQDVAFSETNGFYAILKSYSSDTNAFLNVDTSAVIRKFKCNFVIYKKGDDSLVFYFDKKIDPSALEDKASFLRLTDYHEVIFSNFPPRVTEGTFCFFNDNNQERKKEKVIQALKDARCYTFDLIDLEEGMHIIQLPTKFRYLFETSNVSGDVKNNIVMLEQISNFKNRDTEQVPSKK